MDCGVAAVSCMLSGFGIDANYEKLREACQTQVDGTSIDALEDLCSDLGLDVVQHVLPRDLVIEAMEGRMPLIAILEPLPFRTHFVVAWRRVGNFFQLMDPRGGRVWQRASTFSRWLYLHQEHMSVEDWHGWFKSSSFAGVLLKSARSLLSESVVSSVCIPILTAADPRMVGALDAALRLLRMTTEAAPKTREWRDALFQRALSSNLGDPAQALPRSMWSVHLRDDEVMIEGSVLLAVESPDAARSPRVTPSPEATSGARSAAQEALGNREESSLLKNILEVIGPEARWFVGWISVAMATIAIASAVELLTYRAALDFPRLIGTPETRVGASIALMLLLLILLGLEAAVAYGGNRLGRVLELKLRMKTMWALPRVEDDFIKSRPTSDLAYRAQALSTGAQLIPSVLTVASSIGDFVVTLIAMSFLDVRYAVIVCVGAALYAASWLLTRSKLKEIDTRLQVHASRLLILLLDGLRGIRPIRLHGYQDSFRDDQRREMEGWRHSAHIQVNATALLQARYAILAVLMVGTIFAVFLHRQGDPRQFVILAFWTFRIPPIITRLVQFAQTYPLQRNSVDRLLEITHYTPTLSDAENVSGDSSERSGVAISMRNVSLVLGGHAVLEEINLDIPAGQHVAVVGASGSGKSSLIGLLLGLHEPTEGELLVNGAVLDRNSRQALRAETLWIDPAVQLWNDSLGANLEYACRGYSRRPALDVLESADLLGVLASVDRGLDTPLGAEGAFVSGGEGQRIRIGRALFRANTRLALLDEAFRGLDRTTRQRILTSVRRAAIRATMLAVSHDISHALSFERVIVVDGGRIVEDGSPQELSTQDSHYARLLRAEKELSESAWSGRRWRRLRVEGGHLHEVDDRA